MNLSLHDTVAFLNKTSNFSLVGSCLIPTSIENGKIKYSLPNQNALYDTITLLNGEFLNGKTAHVFCSEGYIVPSGEPNQGMVIGICLK